MTNYKAIQIIRTFSAEEMKEFEKFLRSPFHSTGRDLLALFNYLKKYHAAYDNDKAMEIEHIHNILSAKKKGKAVKSDLTRKLLSDLYKQAEKFITIKQFLGNEETYTLSKIRALNSPATNGLLVKTIEDHKKRAANERKFSISNFSFDSDVYLEEYSAMLDNSDLQGHFPVAVKSFDYMLIGALASFYLQHAAFFTFRRSYNYDPSNSITDKLSGLIDHNKLQNYIKKLYPEDYPYIELCHLVYLMFQNPEEMKYYFLLKDKLYANIGGISHAYKFNFFKYLESYLIHCVRETNKKHEMISLSKDMLRLGLYSHKENSVMHVRVYINLTRSFYDSDETEFAEEFVRTYNSKLKEEFRTNMLNLGMTYVMLGRGDYNTAIEYFAKVNKDTPDREHSIYFLDIILKFELGYYDESLYSLDAYEHYLRSRENISESSRKGNLHFTRLTKKLILNKTGGAAMEPGEFKMDVTNTKPLNNVKWLLEKAAEL